MFSMLINFNKNSERCSLFLFALLLSMLALSGCEPNETNAKQVVFSGPIMGTEYRVTVITQGERDHDYLEQVIVDTMALVNSSMSNYLDNSEITQFNNLPANQAQMLSPDFTEVITEALEISKISQGAFDVTLARAIDAWGFGPDGEITQRPTQEQLDALKASTGYDKLRLKGRSLEKRVDDVEISLSAIAKGYAVDKVAIALNAIGLSDYLINIGGELRASGRSIDGRVWRVGIEKPHILGGIQEVVELDNSSIATSGDYRNYLTIDGAQFSHMIDAKTLKPVYHKLALVSIISERASTADALATAMMAMDETRAIEFAQNNDLAAYFIIRGDQPENFEVKMTEKFKAYLQ